MDWINHEGEESAYNGYVGLPESFDLSGGTPKTAKGNSSYDQFFLHHFHPHFLSGFLLQGENFASFLLVFAKYLKSKS